MSTKIELEFFSVDEKLPEKSCDVIIVSSGHLYEVHYSKAHNLFNAHDHQKREEAVSCAIENVTAWAYRPDWRIVT